MIDHCYCKACVQYIYPHMVSTFYVRNTQNNILKYVSCKLAACQIMTHGPIPNIGDLYSKLSEGVAYSKH